ncbi:glycosyltransferase [Coraliomargarita akajimensis]|uniref:Glycosyl transferase family 2 n=1 Tax=Coraliomargarita akajimensis (strain DSM 45221 / IAM 15411 / JCM 23193 / KCTC 12865 / 04OKA010-24) TaxID=583355 RepID=D5EM30_CORAD|nr:glycosyltransferase [Coraliomargarita akajimensis]ADE55190.1 glycosyl transferase family 2 [Coraliomargarita akajimensis DSM 45221]
MASYSIIIPAYNEAAELPETLAAIRKAMQSVEVRGELIVVDNNSNDDTAEVARAHGADQVVFEPQNQIARARNAGARACSAPSLIFIDADSRIEPELLQQSLQQLDSGKVVAGGAVIEFEGQITAVGRAGIRLWKRISKLTKTAAGSYLFCRRDAFEAVGGFDEKLYASEEVHLSRKLRKWGRANNQRFVILSNPPVRTSARKLEWYSSLQILGWVALMIALPIAVRSKRLCAFWYERPSPSKPKA